MRFGSKPLSYIRVVFYTSPDAITVLQALIPFTIVNLAVLPGIYTIPMGFS